MTGEAASGGSSVVRRPLLSLAIVVTALFFIADEFPFSNFPMYSNFDGEAQVLFVTDENGTPFAMKRLFNRSASSAKKIYKTYLEDACEQSGIDVKDARPEDQKRAAEKVMAQLFAQHKRKKFEELTAGAKSLQLRLHRIRLQGNDFMDTSVVLAESPL